MYEIIWNETEFIDSLSILSVMLKKVKSYLFLNNFALYITIIIELLNDLLM